ncbi:hypothetical protein DPMN_101201 [Dreissena polymorpha]|uniref:Uncharacterized protein n=1 Tax=Dreissena polymorpha TaxID=45954 RepID=A0A9D4LIZ9_DREPO|nr:hypothetical protein DPMN_101201 [Dreissena polymorpha]
MDTIYRFVEGIVLPLNAFQGLAQLKILELEICEFKGLDLEPGNFSSSLGRNRTTTKCLSWTCAAEKIGFEYEQLDYHHVTILKE